MNGKEKYIVIIGVSLGIGYEIVKVFVKCGKNLVIVVCSKENLEKLKEEILNENFFLDVIVKCVDLFVILNVY